MERWLSSAPGSTHSCSNVTLTRGLLGYLWRHCTVSLKVTFWGFTLWLWLRIRRYITWSGASACRWSGRKASLFSRVRFCRPAQPPSLQVWLAHNTISITMYILIEIGLKEIRKKETFIPSSIHIYFRLHLWHFWKQQYFNFGFN